MSVLANAFLRDDAGALVVTGLGAPAVKAEPTALQTIPGALAETKVVLSSAIHDRNTATAQFDNANDQLVCREAGLYVVTAAVLWNVGASTRILMRVRHWRAGVFTTIVADEQAGNATNFPTSSLATQVDLQVNDSLALYVYTVSSLDLWYAAGTTSNLAMCKVGA